MDSRQPSGSDASGLFFHVNLSTYTDLARSGSAVIPFCEMAFDLADRAGIPLRISLERSGARRSRTGTRLTDNAWQTTRAALEGGDFVNFFAFNDAASTRFGLTLRGGDVYDTIAARVRDAKALERIRQAQQARPTPRFVNLAIDHVPDDVANTVQISKGTFEAIDGACGFVTLDPFQFISGDQTQHELAHLRHWSQQPDIFQTRLRGVYWGNLLSARHVALVGLDVARAQRLAKSGAYVQVSDDPRDLRGLDELERQLRPLLD